MDFVSHAIIGGTIGAAYKEKKRNVLFAALFAVLPDITQIPLFFYVGYLRHRFLWIPYDADWAGVRAPHPGWSALWDIPHSLFFVLFVMAPLGLKYKWPRLFIYAYLSHIVIDMFTHVGEWTVKPFYPFNLAFQGFTSAWTWPWAGFMGAWTFLSIIFFVVVVISFLSKKVKAVSNL